MSPRRVSTRLGNYPNEDSQKISQRLNSESIHRLDFGFLPGFVMDGLLFPASSNADLKAWSLACGNITRTSAFVEVGSSRDAARIPRTIAAWE
jgi:hypothetical protein